ncbi:MAG TPA: carbamate kinase [Acidimicrobiia bacterium]|nr:carbamate kinase [Acidimicrobiia bacterium]
MTGAFWDDRGGPPVIAFGGNALLPDSTDPTIAERNAAAFAHAVLRLMPPDTGLVLVHGNGPQVGNALLRNEAGKDEVHPSPLDVLVADTQGSIGYLLGRSLGNALAAAGRAIEVVTVITQVVVDADHPSMRNPTKPVGPFYPPSVGMTLEYERGWKMIEVPNKGMRRVVASPPPKEIVEIEAVRALAASGRIVITGGGGGIPVTRKQGALVGVEGVIDKDRTGSLVARNLDARGFLIFTEVGHASRSFGKPDETPLLELTATEAQTLLDAGEFPPGSMGPKIESCISYAGATGRTGVITNVDALEGALAGTDGTRVRP